MTNVGELSAAKRNENVTNLNDIIMCRLMTTQLEEALKGFPLNSQDGKGKYAICRAIFVLGGVRGLFLKVKRKEMTPSFLVS